MKPAFTEDVACEHCSSPAVGLRLKNSHNFERVTWCEKGHVCVGMVNVRTKKVFDFHKEEVI